MKFIQGIKTSSRTLSCLAVVALCGLLLQSCKKEYFELDRVKKENDWNPEVALPLINTDISMADALDRFDDDEVVVWDNTGLLALKYKSTVFSLSAEDAFSFPDQSLPAGTLVTPSDVTTLAAGNNSTATFPPITYMLDLTQFDDDPTNAPPEIFDIDFKNGSFGLSVTNSANCDIRVDISILNMLANGQPLNVQLPVVANGSNSATINLASYNLDMNATPNEIRFGAAITYLANTGTPVAGQPVNMTLSFAGLEFELILANINEQIVDIPEGRVNMRLYNNSVDGDITWENPILKTYFLNSFGADLLASATTFRAVDLLDSNPNDVDSLDVISPFSAGYTIRGSAVQGTAVVDSLVLDDTDPTVPSNVKDISAIEPNYLRYKVDIRVDPASSTISPNWIADTSKLQMDVEAYLPFFGTAANFSKYDTTDVDIFPLDDDVQEIIAATIRIVIDNGFPITARAQVLFLDSNDVVLDSVFADAQQTIMASGEVVNDVIDQENGRTRTITDIKLDRELLEDLEARSMRKMVLKGWAETTDMGATPVKVFREYSMNFFLGISVEAKVKVEL